ncbi:MULTISPECIES: S1C family serine protease [Mycolicibacterium]|uniref:Serine protease n=1 Tax=Mycolicibacterium wolinskyi TaxID=59750 RepID=A0A132PJW3_9MYCO|nr:MULTISPECIES: S1C family serine protease [Mycolicibacterium]KWX22639.1 serine protease [Mycolicibacterium wolinskyi]MCV7284683.1 serine protease [Mycolicibacterium wolinskyi]MCV7295245.1 serine protease [Mycolicibacterium goodii]ORX17802.1 serine protease [Mycolicibacterium wolinskyi]
MGKLRSRPVTSVLLAAFATAAALVIPSAPAAAAPADPVAAAAQVEPAVARIDTVVDYQQAYGIGTGIVLSPGGEVLTNYHVVQGANSINATVAGQSFAADLVGYDRRNDIAVLQLRGAGGLPVAPIGDSRALAEGEPVVALGNAHGTGAPLTREVGTVTAFGRTVNAEDELTGSTDELNGLFEFAAPVRAGDSGGPVVNSAGQVVGMTTAASVNFRMGPGGKGFAIPINDAMAVAGQIRSRTPSDLVHIGPPTLLGVGVRTAPRQNAGVIIQDVLRGGPAEAAGLMPGDTLTVIDGTPLDSARTLTLVLDRRYPGDVIDLTWLDRSGQERTGKATLAAGP